MTNLENLNKEAGKKLEETKKKSDDYLSGLPMALKGIALDFSSGPTDTNPKAAFRLEIPPDISGTFYVSVAVTGSVAGGSPHDEYGLWCVYQSNPNDVPVIERMLLKHVSDAPKDKGALDNGPKDGNGRVQVLTAKPGDKCEVIFSLMTNEQHPATYRCLITINGIALDRTEPNRLDLPSDRLPKVVKLP
jgi:hypothetical protein